MDFADGGDLWHKTRQQRKEGGGKGFPEERIVNWITQIALALHYCHSNRTLHRDIKTANIFLMKDDTVKVGDFGLHKNLDPFMENAKYVVQRHVFLFFSFCCCIVVKVRSATPCDAISFCARTRNQISRPLYNVSPYRTLIGTPSFLSPEVCRHESYNHKSDIWSFGIVCYGR
jgi:NIMA (never in mitosis gene a)-related kinase